MVDDNKKHNSFIPTRQAIYLGSVDICFSALEAHRKLACGKTAGKTPNQISAPIGAVETASVRHSSRVRIILSIVPVAHATG